MKKSKTIFLVALVMIILVIFLNNTVLARIDTEKYDPSKGDTTSKGSFLGKIGIVVGLIKNIGIIVSVLVLAIIGIKYMFSSVEGKAEYKKTMVPYIIGCFLLMSTSIVVGIIQNIAKV